MERGAHLTLIMLHCSAASAKVGDSLGDRMMSFLAGCTSWLREQECLHIKLPAQCNVTSDRKGCNACDT